MALIHWNVDTNNNNSIDTEHSIVSSIDKTRNSIVYRQSSIRVYSIERIHLFSYPTKNNVK